MTNIPHYLRLKPHGDAPEDKDKEYLIESQTETTVKFKDTISPNKFTKIFTDKESQDEVYKETLKDITLSLFENQDGVLFTLGPSNSGKSYTILGNISNPGISIYALNDIFNKISSDIADYNKLKNHFGDSLVVSSRAAFPKSGNGQYGVSISVFEIYNDKIRDLSLDLSKTQNQSLDIVTDSKDGKIKPSKIRQIYVSNINDAKLVLHKSTKRRAVSPTNINGKSSRSHLFIHLNLHRVIGGVTHTSRLTIADLAGSERTKTARTEGNIFKEGNYTNQSLTELGRCLKMMQSPKFDSSVLRTSKLTRLLLTDLFRNANVHNKLKIILALDPFSDLSTILHTLRYIQPVSKVPLSERTSMELSHEGSQISKLIEEVASLVAINHTLQKENEKSEEKLMELEIELRQELSENYETKIQELEVLHTKALNELKFSNNDSNDEKLKLLSEDYENRMKELKEDFDDKIDQLEEQNIALIVEHDKKLNELEVSQEIANEVTELRKVIKLLREERIQIEDGFKKEMNSLKKDKIDLESSLLEEIKALKKEKKNSESQLLDELEQVKKEKDELLEKFTKLEDEVKSLHKKEKKKGKRISELESKLEEAQKKRKSDTFETEDKFPRFKKSKTADIYEDDDTFDFDEQESELTSFSPVILSQGALVPTSSPTKSPFKNHFRIPMDASPSKSAFQSIETPLFPKSVSPKKPSKLNNCSFSQEDNSRKILKEVNLDFSLGAKSPKKSSQLKSPLKPTVKSSSKSPLKSSPSKKKKIRTGAMISHDENDLF